MSAITRNTIVGVKKETVEGTFISPAGTDVLHIVDLPGQSPVIDVLDRGVFKGSIGKLKPIKGMHSGTLEIKTEMRAGGATASVSQPPDWDALARSAFGAATTGTNSTTIAGSTASVIKLTTGQGANFAKFDVVFILGEVSFIISISTDDLTLNEDLTKGAPGSGVAVRGGTTYKPASTGHDSLSVAIWEDAEVSGKEFRGKGCRVANLSLEDLTVGQLPRLVFSLEMLDFDQVIGTAPTPTFLAQLPAAVIQGRATKGDATLALGTVEFEMAQTISREKDINAAGGVTRMFVTGREITGSINPFVNQADVTFFTQWKDNTSFELFVVVGIRDSNGDLVQGSCVALYMPQVLFSEFGKEDLDGSLVHNLGYAAHESDGGTGDDEVFLGVI